MIDWRGRCGETLRRAAAGAVSISADWRDYAEFCLKYERGLRREAFHSLDRFIPKMERFPFQERRRFVSWLMRTAYQAEGARMIVPYPLKVRVVEPTLLEWTVVEPQNSEPHRWIGDREHLEFAVNLNPSDAIAARMLVLSLLAGVAYATHELPYGYLGVVQEDLDMLKRVEDLLPSLSDESDQLAYAAEIAGQRQAIAEYLRRKSQIE